MARIAAEWTGVIVLGSFELDCRLFGATGRARPLPLRMVHLDCQTVLEEEAVKPTEKEEKVKPEGSVSVEAREQIFCPRCQIPLRADQIGRGVETSIGTILLSEAELSFLKFEPAKRVEAELVAADDPSLMAIGFGRRFYLMPKPAAVETWHQVFHLLKESQRVGLLNPIVIKRKPHVGILRPLVLPAVIFGEERPILALDLLRDTDCLKDPASIPDCPRTLSPADLSKLAQPIAQAQAATSRLDPASCVNPQRARIKKIVKEAVERSLKK